MYLSKNHKVLNALPPLTQFQLDIEQVKDIINFYPKKNIQELASIFNVSKSEISRTLRGERWGGVKKKILNLNNKSGCNGIGLLKNGKWYARIQINNKTYYLGNFLSKQDAIDTRLKAEEKFGRIKNV